MATVLCLTHEGVVEDFHAVDVEFLKPLVGPVTGATHLRLLDYTNRADDFQVTRIDLTLPEPRADDVSPMTVKMRHYKLTEEGEPMNYYGTCLQYADVSEEGHVRGFYRGFTRRPAFLADPNDYIMKFRIDTREDEWVINCGESSPAKWSHLGDRTRMLNEGIMFDGMRGKISSVALTHQRDVE